MGRDRSQREPNIGKRVDVPTIHGADPLIFPLPKHFCGRALIKDDFFLLHTGSYLTNFFV